MTEEQQKQFIEMLRKKTQLGKVRWQPTCQEGKYIFACHDSIVTSINDMVCVEQEERIYQIKNDELHTDVEHYLTTVDSHLVDQLIDYLEKL
jgi:hypothetical protein